MTKEARKALRAAILDKLDDDMLPLQVGGHEITNQLVYAGCSQWSSAGREWDETQSGYAWIVDGEYQLTFPKLDYFDGHNQIERQTKYYLQPDRAENPPTEAVGEPLRSVPDQVMIEIAKGLPDAIAKHEAQEAARDQEAITSAAMLAGKEIPSVTVQEHGKLVRKITVSEALELARKSVALGYVVTLTIDPSEAEASQIAKEEAQGGVL